MQTELIQGRNYIVLEENGEKVFLRISERETQYQMSFIASRLLAWPESLVVVIAKDRRGPQYCFAILYQLPINEGAGPYDLVDSRCTILLDTDYIFGTRSGAEDALERTFRILTKRFYDERANDERYKDDGFTMLNNGIVDWICSRINGEDFVFVSEYFNQKRLSKYLRKQLVESEETEFLQIPGMRIG